MGQSIQVARHLALDNALELQLFELEEMILCQLILSAAVTEWQRRQNCCPVGNRDRRCDSCSSGSRSRCSRVAAAAAPVAAASAAAGPVASDGGCDGGCAGGNSCDAAAVASSAAPRSVPNPDQTRDTA